MRPLKVVRGTEAKKRLLLFGGIMAVGGLAGYLGVDLGWLQTKGGLQLCVGALLMLGGATAMLRKDPRDLRSVMPWALLGIGCGIAGLGVLRTGGISIGSALIPWVAVAFILAAIIASKKLQGPRKHSD